MKSLLRKVSKMEDQLTRIADKLQITADDAGEVTSHTEQTRVSERSDGSAGGSDNPTSGSDNRLDSREHPVRSDTHGYEFAPPHPREAPRIRRLSNVLNKVKNFPPRVSTLILFDSIGHDLKAEHLESSDQVRIRSVGGLCVVSAVLALISHKHTHKSLKNIVWSIGINDKLHEEDHCAEERGAYLKALLKETRRIFPNARVSFIIPFKGGEKVPNEYVSELENAIKEAIPSVRRFRPPSMKHKLNPDGIHLNDQGKDTMTKYLKRFVPPQRVVGNYQANQSSRQKPANYTYSPVPADTRGNRGVMSNGGGHSTVPSGQADTPSLRPHSAVYSGPPSSDPADPNVVNQLAEAILTAMSREERRYSRQDYLQRQWRY